MLKKNQLTITTPNTLILGIAHRGNQTAITGILRLRDATVEDGVIEITGNDLWQTVNDALADVRPVKAKHLLLLTTCADLHRWLQHPHIEQVVEKTVWIGRDAFRVKTGGNEYQWAILRHLFVYVWRCDLVAALPKAERLLS